MPWWPCKYDLRRKHRRTCSNEELCTTFFVLARFALLLGVFGKIGAVIQNVPLPVSGGISIVLFGMIASVGVRILITNRVDFSNSRNLMVASLIFVLGIGINNISVTKTVTISGLAVAAVVHLFALVLPEPKSADLTE